MQGENGRRRGSRGWRYQQYPLECWTVSSTNQAQSASLFLCVTFCPNERLATAVLRLVSSFCGQVLEDASVSSRFYMAAHELAENITKYSTGPRVSLELTLEEDESSH